jgi:uncharacterized membrane protein
MKKSHHTPNGIDGAHSRVYRFYPSSSSKHRKVYKGTGSNGGANPIVVVSSNHLGPVRYNRLAEWANKYNWTHIPVGGCVTISL